MIYARLMPHPAQHNFHPLHPRAPFTIGSHIFSSDRIRAPNSAGCTHQKIELADHSSTAPKSPFGKVPIT